MPSSILSTPTVAKLSRKVERSGSCAKNGTPGTKATPWSMARLAKSTALRPRPSAPVSLAVLGLSFRPDTNDMRQSPAIPIVRRLIAEGAIVAGYDPAANDEARHVLGDGIRLCESLEEAMADAEAVVLVTRWKEFERVPDLLSGRTTPPVIIDGRRMLDKASLSRYEGIGL